MECRGNAENRKTVVAKHRRSAVAILLSQTSHPESGLTGGGCSYFFYSRTSWISFAGVWEQDGDFLWGLPDMTSSGRRTSAQRVPVPNAVLRSDGTLVRLPPTYLGPARERSWKAVIDDWYEDGQFDHVHGCAAVREAMRRLPLDLRDHTAVDDELAEYALRVC